MNNPFDRSATEMDERGAVVMKTSVHGSKCAPVCQSYSK